MAKSDALRDKNQLLFNLSVPLSALKMVRRPMPPQAIHIEKVDGRGAFTPHPHGDRYYDYQQQQQQRQDVAESQQQHQSFLINDSVTSEIFEQALTLAKLDFKLQKRGDDAPRDSERPAKNSKSSDTKLLTTTTPPTATSTNASNRSTNQGVRVIERSSSTKVKNASVQVSRKNLNHLCQNARSPEPTPLSHLPATTNSPPTHDTHDCTRQKFQKIHNDVASCLTDLQTLLTSFIKEGLNELTESGQEAGGSSQDLTIVKVVSRKLYSIKHQAQDLKRQVDHRPKNKGQLLGPQCKDRKYLSNRLASIFQGILRIFLDMCRYLKKPTYTLNTNMVFVCVVHLVHMLNVLSLLIDIWSEMTRIPGKPNESDVVDDLHEMIASTKLLCSQFQYENKPPPQSNIFNQSTERPIFTTDFSRQPDTTKNKDKDGNRMKTTTSRTINTKGKTSLKSRPTKSLPSKKTSIIYPADLQFHRKPCPAPGRQKPSLVRQLDLHGSNPASHGNQTAKSNTSSKQATSRPEVPLSQRESFDSRHIRQIFRLLAQSSSKGELPKPQQTPAGEVVDNNSAKNSERPPKPTLQEPRSTQTNDGPSITNKDLRNRPPCKPAGPSLKDQASPSVDDDDDDKERAKSSETLLQSFFGMSSIDKMIVRLQEIEEEQLKIRHTWSNLVYPTTSLQKPSTSAKGVQAGVEAESGKPSQGCQQSITSPKVIMFTKVEAKSTDQPKPAPSHRCCSNVQIAAGYTKACCSAASTTGQAATPPASAQTRLFLQKHTLDAVRKNRAAYLLYLKNSAYHQVENFDPWDLTEKIADAISTDCVADVLGELEQLSDDIIQQIYEDEFACGARSEL